MLCAMTGKQAAKMVDAIVATGWSREAIAASLGRTTSSFDKWAKGVTPRVATAKKLRMIAVQRGVALRVTA